MIIYRADQPPLLADFGIEVPMLKGRAVRVYEELLKEFGEEIFFKEASPIVTEEDFNRAHSEDFIKRCLKSPEKVIEETFELINPDGSYNRYNPAKAKYPLKDLVGFYQESVKDTYLGVKKALDHGFSYYLGGGFHHSMTNMGRGFCLFNDIVIAARKIQKEMGIKRIWVIDIDAHKGCGTAEMTAKDESISTLSIHMKHGWPLDSSEKDQEGNLRPWFIPSSVDVGVADGEEEIYLEKLQEGLKVLKDLSSVPELCIVVDGSDPYEGDALPSANHLKLTKDQCFLRNKMVYQFLKSLNIPQSYVMSGGYGEKNWIIHHQFIRSVLRGEI